MSFHQKRIKLLLTEKEAQMIYFIFMNKQMEYQEDGLKEEEKMITRIMVKLSNAENKAKT